MHAIDLIFLGLTVVVAYRLYNILGQKKESSSTPFQKKENWEQKKAPTDAKKTQSRPVVTALKQIQHEDPTFTQENFLMGAEKAFEMIITNFIKGDKPGFKSLVNNTLFKQFSDSIDRRKEKGTRAELAFFRVVGLKLKEIKVKNHRALIQVLFESEQTQLLKGKAGELLEGDPEHIDQLKELWTFERPLKTKTPNWVLCETISS